MVHIVYSIFIIFLSLLSIGNILREEKLPLIIKIVIVNLSMAIHLLVNLIVPYYMYIGNRSEFLLMGVILLAILTFVYMVKDIIESKWTWFTRLIGCSYYIYCFIIYGSK